MLPNLNGSFFWLQRSQNNNVIIEVITAAKCGQREPEFEPSSPTGSSNCLLRFSFCYGSVRKPKLIKNMYNSVSSKPFSYIK